jgi:DNA polymerase-3 subunit delta
MIEMLKRHEVQVLRRAGHTWKEIAAHLKRGLAPVYTVWGDEPLLAQEAADAIRAAARAAGCSERQVHTVSGAHFDWSSLLGAAQALSLFADRQLVEIRIPSGKPGSSSERIPLANTRGLASDPSASTSKARIRACTVSLT